MLRRLMVCLFPKRSLNFLFYLCCTLMLHSSQAHAQYVEGLKIVSTANKFGYASENGKVTIPALYDEAQDFREGHAFVRLGKWGEIDNRGEVIIPVIYDSIRRFSSGAVLVRKDDKLGLFRKDGREICPILYDDITVWYDLFVVKLSGKWGLIDQRGKVILPIAYDSAPVMDLYDMTMRKGALTCTIDYKGDVTGQERTDSIIGKADANTQHR